MPLRSRHGANIFLCKWHDGRAEFAVAGHWGQFHTKALLVDNRTVYLGSTNFTKASRKNVELQVRMQGPPVIDVAQALLERRSASTTRPLGA